MEHFFFQISNAYSDYLHASCLQRYIEKMQKFVYHFPNLITVTIASEEYIG